MTGRWCERAALGTAERDAMLALLDRHFLGVTRDDFERDLAEKDYVVVVTDATEAVRGFTTFALGPSTFAGRRIWALFSGDTIVDRSARSSFALARTWIGAVRRLQRDLPEGPLWWLLICSSHRTYRFLPVFFRFFVPRPGLAMPDASRRLRDHLAAERYGAAYDPATGIVRLARPQALRPELRSAPGESRDEIARSFARWNPGHARGDELACLTEIHDENLTRAGWRMVTGGREAPRPAGPTKGTR